MPEGFCCSHCFLYNEQRTCLKTKTKRPEEGAAPKASEEELKPVSTSIEDGLLRVVIKKKGEEIPIYIDLQKHLE
jgi:hypothetical protein